MPPNCAATNLSNARDATNDLIALDRTIRGGGGRLPAFGCSPTADVSKAALPECPESCTACADQYIPAAWREYHIRPYERHCDREAQEQVQKLCQAIDDNLKVLRGQIESHRDALMKRWQRRAADKRAALVLTALPEACKRKCSSIELTLGLERVMELAMANDDRRDLLERFKSKGQRASADFKARHRPSFLIPYLDVPTLAEDPMRLLALMQHRAYHPPQEWVLFDSEQLKYCFDTALVMPAHNAHCVVMYGKHFARLIQWNQGSAHRWDIIGYPRAQFISTLTGFMCRMTELVLGSGVDEACKGCSRWLQMAGEGFVGQDSSAVYSGRRHPAFQPPPTFNADAILAHITLRRDHAADQLWLVQTDPLFLRDHVGRLQNTTYYDELEAEHKRQRTMLRPLSHVTRYNNCQTAVGVMERMVEQQRQFGEQIKIGKVVPNSYAQALEKLEHSLFTIFKALAIDLLCSTLQSKGFQAHQSLWSQTDKEPKGHAPNDQRRFRKAPLYWFLLQIGCLGTSGSMDASALFDFFEHTFTNCSAKERSGVEQLLLDKLSDAIAVMEAWQAVRYHRPRHGLTSELLSYPASDGKADVGASRMEEEHSKSNTASASVPIGNTETITTRFADDLRMIFDDDAVWKQLKVFLDSPMPGSKTTIQSLLRLKSLYVNMVGYWACLLKAVTRLSKSDSLAERGIVAYMAPVHGQAEMFMKEMQRTCDELDQLIEAKQRDESARLAHRVTPSETDLFKNQMLWVQEQERERIGVPKQKVKRRPLTEDSNPATSVANRIAALDVVDRETVRLEIRVKPNSQSLFTGMFASFAWAESATAWDSFVAAMVDAGCSATRNGGSAVTFRDMQHGRGSIVFHRPHPDPSIDPIMLQSMGKRLRKWFDWEAETFVERV